MFTFLVVVTSVVFLSLVFVAAIKLKSSGLSRFELERRSKNSKEAKEMLRRDKYLPDIALLRRIKEALLLVILILMCVVTFGWLIGVIVGVVLTIFYGSIAKISFIKKLSNWAFKKLEPHFINLVEKFHGIFKFLGENDSDDYDLQLGSKEELRHLIEEAGETLTDSQKQMIGGAINFDQRKVGEIMTPRGMIKSISNTEFLGPLVLSELHDQGYSRLPVIKEDVDHVVGILYLRDMLTLKGKNSATADKLMDPKVFYIHQDQTLDHALAAFIKSRHHLFIVINELRETVGLLTLEDVVEALIGRKILDEDDHTNIEQVAKSIVNSNNQPKNHIDV